MMYLCACKMRQLVKIVILLFLTVVVFSCNLGKNDRTPFAAITDMVDSAAMARADSAALADSLRRAEEEEVKPVSADELFEDFMFNFSSDARFQRSRVVFPLEFHDADTVYSIERKYWKQDTTFNRSNTYYILFDRESDLDLEGDTSLNAVRVEWVYLGTMMQKTYLFERMRGAWMLSRIDLLPVADAEEGFTDFYRNFVTDSLFQSRHVANPLEFVTVDPDDEFSILHTTLGVSEWFAFRPDLPVDVLPNIDYGQQNSETSTTKVIKLNGSDGYSAILYFHKRRGEWMLYKFEDTSI